ncbi:MAG: acyl-CoA thioesterase [Deinococcales bacterium]
MPFSYSIRVRYSEVDMQGVVFNANYLAYCDDAFDTFVRTAIPEGLEAHGVDVMLKKAILEWVAPARMGDSLQIKVNISSWGNTSFTTTFTAEGIFSAEIVYVCVQHKTTTPTHFPDHLRQRL